MEKELIEFVDWIKSEHELDFIIETNSDNAIRNITPTITVHDTLFSLSIGTNNNDIPESVHNDIYHKLDNLNLLNDLYKCNAKLSNNTKELIYKAPNINSLSLGEDISEIDISHQEKLENIDLHLVEISKTSLPPSVINIHINVKNDITNDNILNKNLFRMLMGIRLITLSFGLDSQCKVLDISNLNLPGLVQLSISTANETIVNIGERLENLEYLDIYGNLQNPEEVTIQAKLPRKITSIVMMDCTIINADFFSNETILTKLTLINVNYEKINLNSLLKHGEIEELTISECIVDNINFEQANFSELKEINFSQTNLSDISFISTLPKLKTLDLSVCDITTIPEVYPESLSSLSLSNNHSLTELPPTISKNIKSINVGGCGLVNIPKYYLTNYEVILGKINTSKEKRILLNNNPIENPPLEILTGSLENVQSYIDSMIGDTSILNEAKIIFVGDGSVGKTSLMKRLVHDEFNSRESQTDGIEIEPYKVDLGEEGVVNATIWDFGGQQILQATHQLFLSKRSIYVLVVEDRKNDKHKDQDIEQWLTQINSLGGRPPILVVKNKVDENPHSDIQTQKLKTKFSNIVGFFEVSCEKRIGLDRLDAALTECIRTLTMRKIALPNNWLNVKHQLKEQACNHDLLYLNTYKEICEQNGLNDRFAKDTLLRLLHDLGAVIAFEELKSHNTAILNPHWITEGVYAIIRSEALAASNGVITLEGVQSALDSYSEHNRFEDKASYILDAMRNFELCHITEETNTYLIPALLPPQINLDTTWADSAYEERITFLFKFEHLMPPPLIPMFLVKMHGHILGEQRWRSGAIISPSHIDARALVDADTVTREIKLTIMGEERRDLLILLRSEINGLARRLADINEIGLQELIALGDSGESISYDELIGLKRMREFDFAVGKLGKRFKVNKLLGEIEPPADTEQALKTLMESSGNGLLNIHMSQRNDITATGGSATSNVTANNTNTNNNTVTTEVKQDFRALKGQAEFVLEDIRYEIEGLTSSDRQLKDYATKECDKVQRAINELEKNVDSQETADENLRHFSRIQNFLEGALKKTNNVGKVINQAGDVYDEVGKLATRFNGIAEKFGIPTTVVLTGLGLG
ncbi:Ras family protein [Vibrio crassostreae]|nr:Ras family protein [Vibrio crassostreae]